MKINLVNSNKKCIFVLLKKNKQNHKHIKTQTIMTRQQLIDRVKIRHASGYGQYTIYITYRGKEYKCHSTNSEAYDWYDDDSDQRKQLEALRMAWNECKRANYLN